MKHCHQAEDQFSARYEGELSQDEARQLEQHLAGCSVCREAYTSFEAGVSRLRSLKIAATAPEYAEQVSAAVHAQGPHFAVAAGRTRRRKSLLFLSHAAAVLLGASVVLFAGGSASDDTPPDSLAQLSPPMPTIIEVPVEKRVEVPVEVRVEVPVEVVKELIVERVEYVDRPVPNPLQLRLDEQQVFATELAGAFHELLLLARLAEESSAREAELRREPRDPATELATRPAVAPRSQSAPMLILREDDHVRIRTRGEAEDVVPGLIAALDGPDRELAAAAEQHLSSIRLRLAEQEGLDADAPATKSSASRKTDSGFRAWLRKHSTATREEPAPEASPRERWQEWWNARSLAQAETRAP